MNFIQICLEGIYIYELYDVSFSHMFPTPRPIYAGGSNEYYVRCVSFSGMGHQIVTVADDG